MWHILTYKGYEINGKTFYIVAQDKRSTNQNSGVRIDATDPNGNKQTYYGCIEEIWELDYGPYFKVLVLVPMGEGDRRWGNGGPSVRNGNGGP